MIQAQHIYKTFGTLQVLHDISLSIAQGEVVSIIGRSGAGKTTLLQILGTLAQPDRHPDTSIRIGGKEIQGLSDSALSRFRGAHIGFVFQSHQLLPEFTALENVAMPALILGKKQKEAQNAAHALLERLGLAHRTDHLPAQLSGGERQRVAVARALINQPDIVFADEPSGALDTHNKQSLHELFFSLRKDLGQTFLIVTHDESLARMSDRVIRMQDGQILHGAPLSSSDNI